MQDKTWTFVDKSDWGAGPWQDEPDKVQWTDRATGLPCLAVRSHLGNWCGYVGVSEDHPYFEVGYDDVSADVHGGLTFADECSGAEHGVCHVVEPGENDHVWWLGFDCAHAWDDIPGNRALLAKYDMVSKFDLQQKRQDHYWTLPEVQAECVQLAAQIAAATDAAPGGTT